MVPRHPAQRAGSLLATTATLDLDLALALSSWDAYRSLGSTFPRVGSTGIRFRIAEFDVDLLPFGDIEDPQGIVDPRACDETLSVWAFEEIPREPGRRQDLLDALTDGLTPTSSEPLS